MTNLYEANSPESTLVVYQDDNTGKRYYWNGKELVYIGTSNPQIGDRGSQETAEREAEERRKTIEKEREEAQRAKDAGEDYDPAALMDDETEEERQQRIKDIQNMLDDESTGEAAQKESKSKVDIDRRRQKANDLRNAPNSKIQRFSQSIQLFIAKELKAKRKSTWQKPNMSYEGSSIIKRGRRVEAEEKIPKINVYFDQSGSWDENDIKVGMEAIGVLKNYEDRKEIKVDLYYFSDDVYTDAAEARYGGSTSGGAKLMYHIIDTKPDNVIIMTDDDIGNGWNEIYEAPKVKVPGAVWFLFRRDPSPALPTWLKGLKQNWAFII